MYRPAIFHFNPVPNFHQDAWFTSYLALKDFKALLKSLNLRKTNGILIVLFWQQGGALDRCLCGEKARVVARFK